LFLQHREEKKVKNSEVTIFSTQYGTLQKPL